MKGKLRAVKGGYSDLLSWLLGVGLCWSRERVGHLPDNEWLLRLRSSEVDGDIT